MEKNEFSILVVDDEEDIRENLKIILETEGYNIFDADSGEEAIKILQNNKIDLVLLDLKMKGISCLLYTSPSPRDRTRSRMPSSA
mgnify:CR=1 FL=1